MECRLTPCCFTHHPKFIEEIEKFINHHCSETIATEESIKNIERLLTKHFYEKSLQFTAKHLGQAQGFSGFTVYWLHMVIPNCGLSRTQIPKMHFYKANSHISFLCLNSHLQNYKDSQLRKLAYQRLLEMIEVIKTHQA